MQWPQIPYNQQNRSPDQYQVPPIYADNFGQPIHRQLPQYQAPPVHKHLWIENDSYKWCIECRALNLKLRGTWFLFVRYGLKFIWIIFLLDLVLALSLVSYFHINR